MSKPDWAAIEADYLATGMRHEDLAKKWSVPLSTVKKRAMRGKWGEKLKKVARAAEPPEMELGAELFVERKTERGKMELSVPVVEQTTAVEYAQELRALRAQKMIETTDAMMDRIIDALQTSNDLTPYSIKLLASALRDLREMQGLNKSALDIEEQRARIDKIRAETYQPSEEKEPLRIEFVNIEGADV